MKIVHKCVEGKLPSTDTILYTVPIGCRTTWHSASVLNTTTDARLTHLLVRAQGSTSIHVLRLDLNADDSAFLVESELPVLSDGNTVRGYAEAANVVEYVLSFIEEHEL